VGSPNRGRNRICNAGEDGGFVRLIHPLVKPFQSREWIAAVTQKATLQPPADAAPQRLQQDDRTRGDR
jgi:hypothetical protein